MFIAVAIDRSFDRDPLHAGRTLGCAEAIRGWVGQAAVEREEHRPADRFVLDDVGDAHGDDRATTLDRIVERRLGVEDAIDAVDEVVDQRVEDVVARSEQVVERGDAQAGLARELELPVIIHHRDAEADLARILEEERASDVGGVLHSFTASYETAEAAMGHGFFISFSGILTFKNAERLREVARALPLDRLIVETDCPYLAPVPHRGKRNEPVFVLDTAAFIAQPIWTQNISQQTWG